MSTDDGDLAPVLHLHKTADSARLPPGVVALEDAEEAGDIIITEGQLAMLKMLEEAKADILDGSMTSLALLAGLDEGDGSVAAFVFHCGDEGAARLYMAAGAFQRRILDGD